MEINGSDVPNDVNFAKNIDSYMIHLSRLNTMSCPHSIEVVALYRKSRTSEQAVWINRRLIRPRRIDEAAPINQRVKSFVPSWNGPSPVSTAYSESLASIASQVKRKDEKEMEL